MYQNWGFGLKTNHLATLGGALKYHESEQTFTHRYIASKHPDILGSSNKY
jgi:hypothetical protein